MEIAVRPADAGLATPCAGPECVSEATRTYVETRPSPSLTHAPANHIPHPPRPRVPETSTLHQIARAHPIVGLDLASRPAAGGHSVFEHMFGDRLPGGPTLEDVFHATRAFLGRHKAAWATESRSLHAVGSVAPEDCLENPRMLLMPLPTFGGESRLRFDRENRKILVDPQDRLFLAFSPLKNVVEILSRNDVAGRFEMLVQEDATDSESNVEMASRATCGACHQSGTPILQVDNWEEFTRGCGSDYGDVEFFWGIHQVPSSGMRVVDTMVGRANNLQVGELLWVDGAKTRETRVAILKAMFAYMILPRDDALPPEIRGKIIEALKERWGDAPPPFAMNHQLEDRTAFSERHESANGTDPAKPYLRPTHPMFPREYPDEPRFVNPRYPKDFTLYDVWVNDAVHALATHRSQPDLDVLLEAAPDEARQSRQAKFEWISRQIDRAAAQGAFDDRPGTAFIWPRRLAAIMNQSLKPGERPWTAQVDDDLPLLPIQGDDVPPEERDIPTDAGPRVQALYSNCGLCHGAMAPDELNFLATRSFNDAIRAFAPRIRDRIDPKTSLGQAMPPASMRHLFPTPETEMEKIRLLTQCVEAGLSTECDAERFFDE